MATPFNVACAHTVRSLIDTHAVERGKSAFLVNAATGETVTYCRLQEELRAFGSVFDQLGIAEGDILGFMSANSLSSARLILAAMYHGRTVLPVNLASGDSQIGYVLEHSKCRVVFTDNSNRNRLEDISFKRNLNIAGTEIEFSLPMDKASSSATAPKRQARALVMYTSGTTGDPKGVVHTQASLLAGGANTAAAHELSETDRALCVLPLYHINGLCVTLFAPLVSGGSVVLPQKFSTAKFWMWAANFNCTWFSVVPTLVSYLLHAEGAGDCKVAPSLRFGRSASSALPPDLFSRFENSFGLPMIETMGLTETAAQILSNPMPPGTRKPGSPGLPIGNEVRIVKDDGSTATVGEEGEIAVHGANVMTEYLHAPEQTAESLVDGWLMTGDLGHLDEDGYFFVTGRKKELIIKGGENIAPREIDDVLHQVPAVVEAAAFGKPCDTYGQRVEACVVLEKLGQHTEKELISLCCEAVGAFKAPERIHFLNELPKGPSGKIQRLKLAELVSGN